MRYGGGGDKQKEKIYRQRPSLLYFFLPHHVTPNFKLTLAIMFSKHDHEIDRHINR